MKLRTVLSTALATAAAALGVGAVAALAQDEDRQRQGQHGDHGPMMGGGDGAMRPSMHRHHAEMMREMRETDPEMAHMMDRHHKEMMGQMHKGGMGGMGPE